MLFSFLNKFISVVPDDSLPTQPQVNVLSPVIEVENVSPQLKRKSFDSKGNIFLSFINAYKHQMNLNLQTKKDKKKKKRKKRKKGKKERKKKGTKEKEGEEKRNLLTQDPLLFLFLQVVLEETFWQN